MSARKTDGGQASVSNCVIKGKEAYLSSIREAGFKNLKLVRETTFPMAEQDERLRGRIGSIAVEAYK